MKQTEYIFNSSDKLELNAVYSAPKYAAAMMLTSIDGERYTGAVYFTDHTTKFSEVTRAELDELIQAESPNRPTKAGRHPMMDKIIRFLRSDDPNLQNVYLYGPAGSGKTQVAMTIANELGLPFYFTNCVMSKYDLIGQPDASGKYHPSPFYKAFTEGGLFLLDEFDASDPSAGIVLNAALANRRFDFPIVGNTEAHPNFRVIAAGNTPGMGATDMFTERQALDAATLDRFVSMHFDYDPEVEKSICPDREALEFIRALRKSARKHDIRIVLGYRTLARIVSMSKEFTVDEILTFAIFKGMDTDIVQMLVNECPQNNKYTKAAHQYDVCY